MNNSKAHEELVDNILTAIGKHPVLSKMVRVWPRYVGKAKIIGTDRIIKYGITGEADLQGIIMLSGRYLNIEVKTGKAILSVDQLRWRAMMVKFGGVHIEGRSVEQVVTELLKYI